MGKEEAPGLGAICRRGWDVMNIFLAFTESLCCARPFTKLFYIFSLMEVSRLGMPSLPPWYRWGDLRRGEIR